MKLIWYFSIAFGVFTTSLLSYRIEDEIKIKFLELLRYYEQPNELIAYVCWDIVEIVKFAKFLNHGGDLGITVLGATVDQIYTPSPEYAHHAIFLADMACDGIMDLLIEAESRLLLKDPYRWIIINSNDNYIGSTFLSEENNDTEFLIYGANCTAENVNNFTWNYHSENISNYENCVFPDILNKLGILPDSDVNVIFKSTTNESLENFSVYRSRLGSNLQMEKMRSKSLAAHRRDLKGAPLKVCYVITDNDTLNHLSDYRNREIDTITKVNFVLTNHLLDFLNASRSFSFVNSWGYKTDDRGWSGMIGELHTKNADIGGSPLFFTADRIPVIDYIAMPSPTRSKFVFRQPKLSYMSNVFALPFRKDVWACSGGLILIIIVVLFISTKWEWSTPAYKTDSENDSETLRPSWSDVTLMTIGSVCQQGSSVQLKGPVGRIVILLSFMSLMFLYTSYSANIVALLQSSSSRIKTLSDLLNSRLKLAVHDTVFNHYYFTGLFAFHMEIGVGYKVVEEVFREEEKCGLQEIQYLQVVDPWLAVQKNSSYKEMFKIGFRRIQEYGLQARENWLLYTKKPHCAGTGSIFVSVGIVDCEPAMLILAYGGLISIILLVLENMMAYRLCLKKRATTLRASVKIIENHQVESTVD